MTTKLEILDGMCGTGKTTGIFKWILNNQDQKFIYVTPFLDEVERAKNSLGSINFITPHNLLKTKSDNLLELLKQGNNITFTHTLFKNMTKEHLYHIQEQNYILIIDEECDLIEPFSDGYTNADIEFLVDNGHVTIDEKSLGQLKWNSDSNKKYSEFKYSKLRNLCNLEMLYASKSKKKSFTVHLPIGLIASAKRVILISYRFEHSIMNHFVKMKGLEVVPFTEVTLSPFDKNNLKKLIEFVEIDTKDYNSRTALSSSWYMKKSQAEFDILGKLIGSTCKKNKVLKHEVMWTAPSEYCISHKHIKKKLKVPSYGALPMKSEDSGCWVACSAKATNNHSKKYMLVHAFNRFSNQTLFIYLRDYGFLINNDEFAISEMIQWVWRSRIRNNEPIKLCFISKRMRVLFKNWLDN